MFEESKLFSEYKCGFSYMTVKFIGNNIIKLTLS